MKQSKFPPRWNDKRVQKVIAHYDRQTEDEAIAEDLWGFISNGYGNSPGSDASGP